MSVLAVLFYVLAIRLDVLVRRRTSRERIDVESFVGSPPASPQSCCSDIELRTRASFFKGAPPSPSPSRDVGVGTGDDPSAEVVVFSRTTADAAPPCEGPVHQESVTPRFAQDSPDGRRPT